MEVGQEVGMSLLHIHDLELNPSCNGLRVVYEREQVEREINCLTQPNLKSYMAD